MESINKYIQDPSWWISAFFIAVFASIIAGFAKDFIVKKFGSFLAWSKVHRKKLRDERQKYIEAWSSNEKLLIISLVGMLFYVVCFCCIATLIFICFIYLMLLRLSTDAGIPALSTKKIVAFTFVVLLASFYAYRATGIIFRSIDAFKMFCKKQGLPPFE